MGNTPTPVVDLLHTNVAYVLCAALIVIYAWDRFNTPPSNRSSTRQLLYWQSCVGYILSALGLFAALSLLLEQEVWRQLFGLKDNQSLPAPLLATLAMTTLLPRVPLLSRLDRSLLDLFLDWGAIPAEVKRRAAALTPHSFTLTGADLDMLRESGDDDYGESFAGHLRERGCAGLERSRLRFTRVVSLYARLQQLAAEPRYSRFFDQNAEEFAALSRQVESFIRGAVGKLDRVARLHALAADPAYQELLQDHQQAFAADCRERFIMMARFLARAVLRSEPSEREIVDRLRRIGFPGAEPMNLPIFPINSLTALGLGVFLYLTLTGYLFAQIAAHTAGTPGVAAMPHSAFAMAAKVTLVRVATLALTVWLIQRYAFFRRAPGEAPRYFAYLVNGVAAAALTVAAGALLHIFDLNLVAGLQRELPLVLLSLMLCTSVAYCCNDWTDDSAAPRWLRPAEAASCGAVMALGMVIILVGGLGSLRAGGGLLLASYIGLPAALGMMVGACVPHIYRESRRAAAARRNEAAGAGPRPADPPRRAGEALLPAATDTSPHGWRGRAAARRRANPAAPARRAGGAG
jgi:hypothetical protein